MPQKIIPLIGDFTTRPNITYASTDKDQKLKGCFIDISSDPIAGESIPFLCKRPGWASVETIVSSKAGRALYASSTAADDLVVIFSDGTVYHKSISWIASNSTGNTLTVSGANAFITDGVISGVNNFFLSTIGTNGCFYLPADAAVDSTPTFTANTNTNTTLSNVSSFTSLYVGQAISGTDIPAGTRIASMNTGASTITMTAAATGTTVGITVTFTQLAKIIDADFTYDTRGAFAFMDGYLFIMDATGKIYNSDINNPQGWNPSNYITGTRVGSGIGVVRRKNTIVGFFSSYHEIYYNAGNPSGSPLSLVRERTGDVGARNSHILSFADRIFWIGTTGGQDDADIYMLSDEGSKKISSPQISRILANPTLGANMLLSGASLGGYNVVFVQDTSAAYSFMYFIELNRWFETSFVDAYVIAGSKRPDQGLYGVAYDDSKLLRNQVSTFQDDSVAFSMIAQTQPYTFNNGLPFIINNINLLADTQSSGSTTLTTSADDYATFGTIGSFDLTSQQKNLPAGGYYDTSVAFRLTDSGNNAWRGQALVVDWEPA